MSLPPLFKTIIDDVKVLKINIVVDTMDNNFNTLEKYLKLGYTIEDKQIIHNNIIYILYKRHNEVVK